MKSFMCVLLLAALVAAEPPRYRQSMFRALREESEGSGSEKESQSESESAPYAASGFKPSKEFTLPSRQELAPPSTSYGTPDNSYGAPLNTYLAPQTEYGVPIGRSASRKVDEKNVEDNDVSAEGVEEGLSEEKGENKKVEKEANNEKGEKSEKDEKSEKGEKKENLKEMPDVLSNQGVYYVLLPGSQLQRIQFQTQNDLSNMAYTARLQYKSEDRAPIYVYSAVPQYQPTSAAYTYYQW